MREPAQQTEQNADLGAFDGLVDLRVVEHDVGRLAAEFQRARDEALRRRCGDAVAHFGGAGERQLVEARMVQHGLTAARTAARQDVDHAGRENLIEEPPELDERERRRGRRLDDDRIAGRQRGRDLPGAHQKRKVPGNDLTDDADRFMKHDRERVFVDLNGAAFLRTKTSGEIAEMVRRERHVDQRRFADGLAVVAGFRFGEQRGIFINQIGDSEKLRRTLRGRTADQSGKAARAAATARSTSAAEASAQSASFSPVAGLKVSKVAPFCASTHSPLMRRPYF